MKFNQRIFSSMRKTGEKIRKRAATAMADRLQKTMRDMMKTMQDNAAAAQRNAGGAPVMRDINSPPAGKETAGARKSSAAGGAAGASSPFSSSTAAPDAVAKTVAEMLARFGMPQGQPGGLFQTPGPVEKSINDLDGADGNGGNGGRDGSGDARARAGSEGAASADAAGRARDAGVPQEGGRFISGSFSNAAGSRDYKLFVPDAWNGQPLPLLVMLHGCTQNPDDFAAGTRMNTFAGRTPALVLYPSQSKAANSSRCWNWFNAVDQKRDAGEPSIIAGMTREIIATWKADASRVHVAGLSAGGAMALIMGATYPDVYAAVGVHSGLPYASAKDLPSALAAMKGGGARPGGLAGAGGARGGAALAAIPVIVFHGDRDHTVNARNADTILAQATAGSRTQADARITPPGGGHAYTRTVSTDSSGAVTGEQWLVHGAGHAWSGGSERGTYTDAKGPDASAEMLRFFATRQVAPPPA